MNQITCGIIVFVSLLSQGFCSDPHPEDCTNPAGKRGLCKPVRNCHSMLKFLKPGANNAEEIRFLQESRCLEPSESDSSLSVCCPLEEKPKKLPSPPYCGIGESDKLIGGQFTFLSEFPWTAIIEYRHNFSDEIRFHCGATLISSRYVLTAAHCVYPDSGDWKAVGVRLGEHDLDTVQDCEFDECTDPPVSVGFEKIIVHEGYSPLSKEQYNDIALIRLDRDIKFSEDVRPVCLPVEESDRIRNISEIWNTKSVGWGLSESGITTRQKLKSHLTILNNESCSNSDGVVLRDTQFCTEMQSDRETCTANSGGSLITRHQEGSFRHNFMYGIASFGKGNNFCGVKEEPAVFTDVTKYIDWIENKIEI